MEIAVRQLSLLISSDFDFKRIAAEEFMTYSKSRLVFLASKMLEMDFVLEGDQKSMHNLNAVSPGFTCAIPFSNYVCDKIDSQLR